MLYFWISAIYDDDGANPAQLTFPPQVVLQDIDESDADSDVGYRITVTNTITNTQVYTDCEEILDKCNFSE